MNKWGKNGLAQLSKQPEKKKQQQLVFKDNLQCKGLNPTLKKQKPRNRKQFLTRDLCYKITEEYN